MSLLENALERLTSIYDKDADSNIGKMIKIVTDEIELIKNSKDDVKMVRDVDQAYGENLDKIGTNVQQERGQLGDSIYRLLIKGKVARNLSDGTLNSIIYVISVILDCNDSEIKINLNPDGEMASIFFEAPLSPVLESGVTREQFLIILQRIVVAGVRVYTNLSGTFEFGDSANGETFDSNKGFSNELQDTGGYLGGYYEPSENIPLPGWE